MSHKTLSTKDGNTIISVTCIDCRETKQFAVFTAHYDDWATGQAIQRAMPEIPESDRELLISGLCGACFDKLFAEDNESPTEALYSGVARDIEGPEVG